MGFSEVEIVKKRSDLIEIWCYQASLCETADRYQQMWEKVQLIADRKPDMAVKPRRLFSGAFRGMMSKLRKQWRTIHNQAQGSFGTGYPDEGRITERYLKNITEDIRERSEECMVILDGLPKYSGVDDQYRCWVKTLRADALRYLAEVTPENRDNLMCEAREFYNVAEENARKLHPFNSFRLAALLNSAVSLATMEGQQESAVLLARDAVNSTMGLPEEDYKVLSNSFLNMIKMPGDDVVDEKFYDPHGTEINFNEQKRQQAIDEATDILDRLQRLRGNLTLWSLDMTDR